MEEVCEAPHWEVFMQVDSTPIVAFLSFYTVCLALYLPDYRLGEGPSWQIVVRKLPGCSFMLQKAVEGDQI